MYCPSCGKQRVGAGQFCVKCGLNLSQSQPGQGESERTSNTPLSDRGEEKIPGAVQSNTAERNFPDLGRLEAFWRKPNVYLRFKESVTRDFLCGESMAWRFKPIDLRLTSQAFVIIPAPEESGPQRVLDNIAIGSVLAGPIGMLTVGLVSAVLADAHDWAQGKDGYDVQILETLFCQGHLLYMPRSTAIPKGYDFRVLGIFSDWTPISVIRGELNHRSRNYASVMTLSVTPKELEKAGLAISIEKAKSPMRVDELLATDFPTKYGSSGESVGRFR